MDKQTRARLEAAGYWVGDAEDWLGLSEEERRMVELRVEVSRLVRHLRELHGLSQVQLAKKMKSSQSRVAKIEAGEADVSLDLSFRALFAAGGNLADLASFVKKETTQAPKRRRQRGTKRKKYTMGSVGGREKVKGVATKT
jgi:ribosome-binding protein aMBF1 (putative translation factor)